MKKTLFYSAVALGSIVFAIASTDHAIAAGWAEHEWNGRDTIDISPQWVDMDQVEKRIKARKRVKNAITEMKNNPYIINMAEENNSQMASVQ